MMKKILSLILAAMLVFSLVACGEKKEEPAPAAEYEIDRLVIGTTAQIEKAVMGAEKKGDLRSLVGTKITSKDNVRMIPDILKSGEEFFFPVFTSAEEMGEYGEHFSKLQDHFLAAVNLAKNNEKNVSGIVINAFSEPFVIPKEVFDIIAKMDSSLGEA